jgi:hypothetical protein
MTVAPSLEETIEDALTVFRVTENTLEDPNTGTFAGAVVKLKTLEAIPVPMALEAQPRKKYVLPPCN